MLSENGGLAVTVSALWSNRLRGDVAANRPTHIISLLDPDTPAPDVATDAEIEHFVLRVKDYTARDHLYDAGTELHALNTFLDELVSDARSAAMHLLVHCHLGASRSPAVAYITLAKYFGLNQEKAAFDKLLGITNKPWPNRGLVALFDELDRRQGRLLHELDLYRDANPRRHAAYRRLNRLQGRV